MTKETFVENTKKRSREVTGDSSDEEEIKSKNRQYNLLQALEQTDFAKLSSRINLYTYGTRAVIDETQIVKSFLLHNLGRMIIYSPKIEEKYRALKQEFLPHNQLLSRSSEEVIDTDALGIKTQNLEDLLALGRLMRRSQIRLFSTLDNNVTQRIPAKILFSAKNQRTASKVTETLVANSNGLGASSFPSTDMVDLHSRKGDYSSAYKDNRYLHGHNSINQTTAAAKILSEKNDNKELGDAVNLIDSLRGEIAQCFPNENSDTFIADAIRKVCKGEPLLNIPNSQDIQDKIYSLTYLLFKTEVYRSPAALVSHIQMLDLIINGEMSLHDAFVNLQMPMAFSGAIKAARRLNNFYNTSERSPSKSFYNYRNPYDYARIDDEDISQLITKEAALMDAWVSHKFSPEKSAEINQSPKEHLSEICAEIYGSLQSFGLNIHSQALHLMTLPPIKDRQMEDEKMDGNSSWQSR